MGAIVMDIMPEIRAVVCSRRGLGWTHYVAMCVLGSETQERASAAELVSQKPL